jgi:ankyrin repeat protein
MSLASKQLKSLLLKNDNLENKLILFQFLMRDHYNYDFKQNLGFASLNNSFAWLFLYRLLANTPEFQEQCLDFLIKNIDKNTSDFVIIRNKIKVILDELSSENNLVDMYNKYIRAGGTVKIKLKPSLFDALQISQDTKKLYGIPIKKIEAGIPFYKTLTIAMENYVEGLWCDYFCQSQAYNIIKSKNELTYYRADNNKHAVSYDLIAHNGRNHHVICCLAQPVNKDAQNILEKIQVYFIQPEFNSNSAHNQILQETLLSYPDIIKEFSDQTFKEMSDYDRVQKIQRLSDWATRNNHPKVSFLEIEKPDDFPKTEDECATITPRIQLIIDLPELGNATVDSTNFRLETIEQRLGAYAIFGNIFKQLGCSEALLILSIRKLSYDEKGNKIYNFEGMTFGALVPEGPAKPYSTAQVKFRLEKHFLVACQLGPETYVYSIYDPHKPCHNKYYDTEQEQQLGAAILQASFFNPPTFAERIPNWYSASSVSDQEEYKALSPVEKTFFSLVKAGDVAGLKAKQNELRHQMIIKQDSGGRSLLYWAQRQPNQQIRNIFHKVARPYYDEKESISIPKEDNQGRTKLEWGIACHQPITLLEQLVPPHYKLETLPFYINNQHDNNELLCSADQCSTLHVAAMHGYIDLADELLKREVGLLNQPSKIDGLTPIMLAAIYGHDIMLHHLIEKGANCCTTATIDNITDGGYSALHAAAEYGHDNCVAVLLKANNTLLNRAETNKSAGYTPLMYAASGGHTRVVCCLLEQDSIEINIKTKGPANKTAYQYTWDDTLSKVIFESLIGRYVSELEKQEEREKESNSLEQKITGAKTLKNAVLNAPNYRISTTQFFNNPVFQKGTLKDICTQVETRTCQQELSGKRIIRPWPQGL